MQIMPGSEAVENEITCPFLQPSPATSRARKCCSQGSAITISSQYATAYCLTSQHAVCRRFVSSTQVKRGTMTARQADAQAVAEAQPSGGVTETPQQVTLVEIEQRLERIGARYVADLRELSEAFARFYAAQLAAKDEQIAELNRGLAAARARVDQLQQAQHEHDTLATNMREVEDIKHERDALAARLHHLERTRFQIMRALAHDLDTVSFAPAPPTSLGLPNGSEKPLAVAQLEAPVDVPAKLVVKESPGGGVPAGTPFVLLPGAVVGRWPGSDIEINDAFISSDHARLTLQEGRWWVADLGSTNGTFVNGKRLDKPTPLKEGDEVRFGRVRTHFTVETVREAAPRRSAQRSHTRLGRLTRTEPADTVQSVDAGGGSFTA
jgi:hypothetical protein